MGLDGIGLSGFRSFGPKMQRLEDFSKVNLIIGKNNSGKSNVLRFIERLGTLINDNRKALVRDPLIDFFRGGADEVKVEFQVKKGSAYTGDLYAGFESTVPKLVRSMPSWADSIWGPFTIVSGGIVPDEERLKEYWDPIARAYDSGDVSRVLCREFNLTGGTRESQLEALARSLFGRHPVKLNARMVPAIRRVTPSSQEQNYPMDGAGLVALLNTLKNPDIGSEEDLERFSAISRFVQDVLGESEAELDISHKVDRLLVRMNGRRLPLNSLGSGIEQVIILASIVTYLRDTVVCIEEPETSLHPELQRKLLEYMLSETSNQYFITTHSNAVFDCGGVSIYHCELVDDATQCRSVTTDRHRGHVLDDLGYTASQILQSNCVVWVEGPSDRVLLNRWIRARAPELREGSHYSIMFYGGRLLAHLTPGDAEVDDFIRLVKINRHTAIVIDSDRVGWTPLSRHGFLEFKVGLLSLA